MLFIITKYTSAKAKEFVLVGVAVGGGTSGTYPHGNMEGEFA